jgi:hypothetical protein
LLEEKPTQIARLRSRDSRLSGVSVLGGLSYSAKRDRQG